MYTINNFLDIKKEIYEYCLNLTITTNNGIKVKHKDRADDLFQEVYLKSYKDLPNINKQIKDKSNYIQIIKNITFWVHAAKFNQKHAGNKVLCNTSHYQNDPAFEYYIQERFSEHPRVFNNLIKHPDFKYFTRNLTELELQIIKSSIEGYNMIEIIKKYNLTNNKFYLVFEKLSLSTIIGDKSVEHLELKLFKRRVINSKLYLKIENRSKIYSLYLNGYTHQYIADEFQVKKKFVTDTIYRIKNKLKNVG